MTVALALKEGKINMPHLSDALTRFWLKKTVSSKCSFRCLYEKIYFLLSESFLLGKKDQFCYSHQRGYTLCLEIQILIFFILFLFKITNSPAKYWPGFNLEIKSSVWYILTMAQSNDSENCIKSKNLKFEKVVSFKQKLKIPKLIPVGIS